MSRAAKLVFLVPALGLLLPIALVGHGKAQLPPTRSFAFEYIARVASLPAEGQKLRLWIPVPQSDNYQDITDLKIESPIPYVIHKDPEYGNHYAYLELTPSQVPMPFEVRMDFHATRREHKVSLDPPAQPTGAWEKRPADLARWLEPDRLVPIDGLIRALSQQVTRGIERPLDKARAIYEYVVRTMSYDKTGEGWGRGDAIYACSVRKGNCTDFHSLFIGMMRAAGIPARFEIGFPLPADEHAGEIPGYHCWAEFWLDGVGWVPVDASEAWKNPPLRAYFFGAHDVNRVRFSRGRDIRFNPAQQGDPVNYFIYPYAELDGKPFAKVEHKFSFRDLTSK